MTIQHFKNNKISKIICHKKVKNNNKNHTRQLDKLKGIKPIQYDC